MNFTFFWCLCQLCKPWPLNALGKSSSNEKRTETLTDTETKYQSTGESYEHPILHCSPRFRVTFHFDPILNVAYRARFHRWNVLFQNQSVRKKKVSPKTRGHETNETEGGNLKMQLTTDSSLFQWAINVWVDSNSSKWHRWSVSIMHFSTKTSWYFRSLESVCWSISCPWLNGPPERMFKQRLKSTTICWVKSERIVHSSQVCVSLVSGIIIMEGEIRTE